LNIGTDRKVDHLVVAKTMLANATAPFFSLTERRAVVR
jgi:hypothetical protein